MSAATKAAARERTEAYVTAIEAEGFSFFTSEVVDAANTAGRRAAKRDWEQYIAGAVEHGHDREAAEAMAFQSLTDRIINGADDEWSGRSNDLRRAYFDGYKSFYAERNDDRKFGKE